MRILMISPNALDATYGAAKVLIELAAALNQTPGTTCDLVGPDHLGLDGHVDDRRWDSVNAAHRRFVEAHAGHYDVVDYDHEHLPFARAAFPSGPLFAARSVLLAFHAERIRPPQPATVRSFLGRLVHGRARASFERRRIADATITIAEADAVNVSNTHDKDELVRRGIDASKISVLPFGASAARRARLESVRIDESAPPTIAFVGTFDYRKGAADMPAIFDGIRQRLPDARLALLGTKGMFATAERVLSTFPRHLRPHIDVRPRFTADELPSLLAQCHVGIFPSYWEGFAFGVLEMLTAGLPVVAYDAPGPTMMLGPEHLVRPGDTAAFAGKVSALLMHGDRAPLRDAARRAARRFDWAAIAQETVDFYRARIAARATQATGRQDVAAPIAQSAGSIALARRGA